MRNKLAHHRKGLPSQRKILGLGIGLRLGGPLRWQPFVMADRHILVITVGYLSQYTSDVIIML